MGILMVTSQDVIRLMWDVEIAGSELTDARLILYLFNLIFKKRDEALRKFY